MKRIVLVLVLAFAFAKSADGCDGGEDECHDLFLSLKDESIIQDKLECMEELGIDLHLEPGGDEEIPAEEDDAEEIPAEEPEFGRNPDRMRDADRRRRRRFRGKRSPEMMLHFIDGYLDLPEDDQMALAECVFWKQDLMMDYYTFDSMEFTERIFEGLLDAPDSAGRNATLNAIEHEECLLEDSEPNLMPIIEFMMCLRGACEQGSSPDVDLM